MLLINKQLSVLGDTKCQVVQTLLVIGVTIPLVTSWWGEWASYFPLRLLCQAANN
jgi:hypothetical protein